MAQLFDPREVLKAPGPRLIQVCGEPVRMFTGTVGGVIGTEPRGEGGFGYDPLFIWPPAGLTFAEMSLESKNMVSHRGRALNKVIRFIKAAQNP